MHANTDTPGDIRELPGIPDYPIQNDITAHPSTQQKNEEEPPKKHLNENNQQPGADGFSFYTEERFNNWEELRGKLDRFIARTGDINVIKSSLTIEQAVKVSFKKKSAFNLLKRFKYFMLRFNCEFGVPLITPNKKDKRQTFTKKISTTA